MRIGHKSCQPYQKITKPTIHEVKVLQKGQRAFFKPLLMVYYFLFITSKKHFKPCFFVLKALKDILQHFKFVNWRIRGFVFLSHEQVINGPSDSIQLQHTHYI